MKSLFNLLILICLMVAGMVYMGIISVEELKDMFLGEVTMGETVQHYSEEDFRQVFDFIIGEVEVQDTSRTAFERSNPLCNKAWVVHSTDALIKYEVKTTKDLFYVNTDSMTYFISDALGVTYYEAQRSNNMNIKESNCVSKKDITHDDIQRCKDIAETNFLNAVHTSDKIVEAETQFETVKRELISGLIKMGFQEVPPVRRFKD